MLFIGEFIGAVTEPRTTVDLTDDVTLGAEDPVPMGQYVPACRVYTKNGYGDDWTLEEQVHAVMTQWNLAPTIPTAELHWSYGLGMVAGQSVFRRYDPILQSQFGLLLIKIEWDAWYEGGTKLVWYGTVGNVIDEQGGVQIRVEEGVQRKYRTGKQRVCCVGLEKMLLDTVVRHAHWWNEDDETVQDLDRGLVFNLPGPDGQPRGNRTLEKHEGTYLFSGNTEEGEGFWNVPQIIEYLCAYNSPRNKAGVERVSFIVSPESLAIAGAGLFRPVVETEGRTLHEIFNQLISKERLLAWFLKINDAGDVELVITSLSHFTVALESQLLALPNPRPLDIRFDTAIGSALHVVSWHEPVDRVRVRGARARSVFSISFTDTNLTAGWTDTQEGAYENAASARPDYNDNGDHEHQKKLNATVRGRPELKEVFAYFKLPDDWPGTAKNGEGAGTAVTVYPWISEQSNFRFYNREVFVLPTLPLKSGYDYTVSAAPVTPAALNEGPHDPLPPVVVIKDADNLWHDIHDIARGAGAAQVHGKQSLAWSADVLVPEQSRGFYLRVQGEPQHILATNDFSPLPADDDHGSWDYQQIIATIAVEWDAYAEGVHPPAAEVPIVDYVREAVFYSHGDYHLDWINAGTVVGIKQDGTLARVYAAGWLADDRAKLNERAKLAFQWYSKPRQSLEFSTTKIQAEILLGDLVRQFGELIIQEVNCIVSAIRIDAPLGTIEQAPPAPKITYTTDYTDMPDFL